MDPNAILQNHLGLVLLVDYKNCNPQGDPDREGAPRIDDVTGRGLITPMGFKRKIRDVFALMGEKIYVARGACYERTNDPFFKSLGIKDPKKTSREQAAEIYKKVTETFIDARLFGQPIMVMPGTCRGPFQFGVGESVDRIDPVRLSTTRQAVEKISEEEKQHGANRMLGALHAVPYGLYRVHIYGNPSDARSTGATEGDYQKLVAAIKSMFDYDRSAGRSSSCVRGLYEFRMRHVHGKSDAYGAVNIERLLETVSVHKNLGVDVPRSFADYTVNIPDKIRHHEAFEFNELVGSQNPYLEEPASLSAN